MNCRIMIALLLNLWIAATEAVVLLRLFRKEGPGFLIYYTTDSNLFAMAASAVYAVCAVRALAVGGQAPAIPSWAGMLRYMAAVGLCITFLVVVFVLSRFKELGGLRHLLLDESMLYTHFLCPVLSLVSFLFFEDTSGFGKNAVWICLAPTFLYAALSVVMNLAKRWDGPYPFLKVYQNGWKKSVLWAGFLLTAFVGIAAVLLALNRLLHS